MGDVFIDAVNRINGKQTGKARFKIGDKVGLGKDSIQNTTWSRKKI